MKRPQIQLTPINYPSLFHQRHRVISSLEVAPLSFGCSGYELIVKVITSA